MIAASVSDSEPVLKLLLQKGADVNAKSERAMLTTPFTSVLMCC